MKKFLKEFRDFIARGNVVDLAVGIIVGAAFTAIVNSLVSDLITPVIGVLTSGVAFEDIVIPLAGTDSGIRIGAFINAALQFVIISLVVFLLVKGVNKIQAASKRGAAGKEGAQEPRRCPYCRLEVAQDATRCPHCTSELPAPEADNGAQP